MSRHYSSVAPALLLSGVVLATACTSAHAQTALLAPTPAAYNWSGFYFGAFGGVGWTDVVVPDLFTDAFGGNFYSPGGETFTLSPEGLFGGGQAGVDWQWGRFVAGVVGEIGFMDLYESRINPFSLPVPAPETQPYTTFKAQWFGSLAGRVGVPLDRILIYAKAGIAFLDVEASSVDPCGRSFCGQTTIDASGDGVLLGWTAGGGAEAALTEHLRVGVEYRYYDFESLEVSGVASNLLEYHQDIEIDGIHTARAFVNYVW